MDFLRYRSQRTAEAKLDREIETLNRLLEDEAYQLSLMPDQVVKEALRNGAVDEVAGGSGSFALLPSNPVPVNGTVGAMAWLSRLQTRHGDSLVFHRLGMLEAIEVYEALSLQRRQWFLFFLDPRYQRASTAAPAGFHLIAAGRPFHGVGSLMRHFPHDFEDIVSGYDEEFRLATVAPNKVLSHISRSDVQRPPAQRIKLEWLLHEMQGSQQQEPSLTVEPV